MDYWHLDEDIVMEEGWKNEEGLDEVEMTSIHSQVSDDEEMKYDKDGGAA